MPATDNSPELMDAIKAMMGNDGTSAQAALGEMLVVDPANATAHFLLGAEYAESGHWDLAERHLATAVVLEPLLVMARFQLGQLLLVNGRFAECSATLQPLATASGALAAYARALISVAHDDAGAAEVALQQGLALPQEQTALTQDMQRLLLRLAGGDGTGPESTAAMPGAAFLLSNYARYN